jgi:hypothetical protein
MDYEKAFIRQRALRLQAFLATPLMLSMMVMTFVMTQRDCSKWTAFRQSLRLV